jgi:hypothetical protein
LKQNTRWFFALIILLLFGFIPLTEASAAPLLDVKATAGYQNKIKYGKGLPLTITVVNSGDEFSGDLVIDYSESYGVGSAKAIPLTIGKGETKTLSLALPGLSDEAMNNNSSTQMFYFYEGGWEEGKDIPYKGSKNVKTQSFGPETFFFLTLTESADRLRALSTMKLSGVDSSQIIHLGQIKDYQFPTDKAAYDLANYLVIDEYVLADLDEDQQQAILDWVQIGGVVIVGASNNTGAELGLLSEQLPLTLSDERKTLKAETLTAFAKKEFTEDVSFFGSKVNEGSRILMKSDNDAAAAVKSIGSGAIIQTAFSLGDEPLSKQANYTYLLTEIMKKVNGSYVNQMNQNYGENFKEQMTYEIGQTNELFPSFQVSTPLMIGIVIIYIILVGPLLYFLLKRKDKREHAWWIIPTISIVASVAIFAYGAKDRLARPQIQQVSFYKVQDDESLSGYYVESLLSNRSGNFTFESEEGTSMVASKRMNSFTGSSNGSVMNLSILQEQANSDQLTVRDVGYWSVSSVLGESLIKDAGKFVIDLNVESGIVRGTVKNQFPFALKDVAIWSGTKMINLGDLGPNESLQVNEPIGAALLSPIASPSSTQYMGNTTTMKANDLPKERKNSLIRMSQMMSQLSTEPAVVAHTEDAIVPIKLTDSRAEMSAINVVYQSFTPETIFNGEFILPAASLEIEVIPEDSSGYYEQMIESKFDWRMSNGSYSYEWKIPTNVPLDKVKWSELQLANTDTSSISVEIYNVSTKAFKEVNSGRFSIKENVNQYISTDGKVKFKVYKQATNGDDYTRLPELRLKGEVQK